MQGKLFGVGVGPGDPKLITLKAKEVLESADILAYPVKSLDESSRALHILTPVVNVEDRELMPLVFSMEPDEEKRKIDRKKAAEQIKKELESGKNIAMAVLGDISIYSTYHQLYGYIQELGFEVETIPGISAFSNGAARLGISLIEGNEAMSVISSLSGKEELLHALNFSDTVIVMKAGKFILKNIDLLKQMGLLGKTAVLCNMGMEGEYIGRLEEDREYGYFTTLIIKKGGL